MSVYIFFCIDMELIRSEQEKHEQWQAPQASKERLRRVPEIDQQEREAQEHEDGQVIELLQRGIEKQVDQEKRRERFSTAVQDTLDALADRYVQEVKCRGSADAFEMYKKSVEAYKSSGKLKRLFTPNPEVTHVPLGYSVAKVIENYSDTMKKPGESVRIIYPAAGGDVAGLLKHMKQLEGRNITLIFVDPGESQTGTPASTLIPELSQIPNLHIENHISTLGAYLQAADQPVDIVLYDSPSLHHGQAAVYGTSPIALEGVASEQLQKLFHADTIMIGDNRGIEHVMDDGVAQYFQKNFKTVDNTQGFPLMMRSSQDQNASVEKKKAVNY